MLNYSFTSLEDIKMVKKSPKAGNIKDASQSNNLAQNNTPVNLETNVQMEMLAAQLPSVDKMSLAEKMQLVRTIWLAGLGAYSNSLTGQRMAGEKSSIFFEELLSRGKQVEYDCELSTHEQHISLHGLDKLAIPPRRHQHEQAKIARLQARIEALAETLKRAQSN